MARPDPQILHYLDALNAFDAAAGPRRTLEEQRAHYVGRCEHFERPAHTPEVNRVDLAMPGPAGAVPVRLYRPGPGSRPAIIFAHGGGWVLGNLQSHDAYAAELAADTGAVVFAVDYRLAPEHRYPAAFDDVMSVVEQLAREGSRWEVDPARLAVAGDSAGGNLAAAVALASRDRGGPTLRGQLLLYPCLDPTLATPSCRDLAEGPALTRQAMVEYWEAYLGGANSADAYAVPTRAATLSGLCPAMVTVAECDLLKDEARLYARRLEESGVRVELLEGPGLVHGYIRARHMSTVAREQLRRAAAWLRARLHA